MNKYKNFFTVVLVMLFCLAVFHETAAQPDTVASRCRKAMALDIRLESSRDSIISLLKDIKNDQDVYLQSSLYPDVRGYYEKLNIKLGEYYSHKKDFPKAIDLYVEADRYSDRGYGEAITAARENYKRYLEEKMALLEPIETSSSDMTEEISRYTGDYGLTFTLRVYVSYYDRIYREIHALRLDAAEIKSLLEKMERNHPVNYEIKRALYTYLNQWDEYYRTSRGSAYSQKKAASRKKKAHLENIREIARNYHIFAIQERLDEINVLIRTEEITINHPPGAYRRYLTKNNNHNYWEAVIDGHVMVYIPETEDGKGGFFVGKYEVSFAQLETHKEFRTKRAKLNKKLTHQLTGQHPAVVSFREARAYCQQKGFRLLTPEEWEWVAGKHNGHIYSWGNREVDEGNEYRANYDDGMDFKDGFKMAAPVKSFEKYPSPYGLVNLSGNVWEWVRGGKCKGGGFMSEKQDLKITSDSTGEIWVGFRCVKGVTR